MGARRKKETYTLNEKSQPHWSWNCGVSAKNLVKSDLGGVIFGCTHSTIRECYSKQLFGLPAPHISYVEKIKPGLTLFLFNYSERKLHGIFQAASHGQLCIDPHAWAGDGSDATPYAAQVRIRVQMPCHPLPEDQFKLVIQQNYYNPKHFWFELDRVQTEGLIDLFSASSVKTGISESHIRKQISLSKTSTAVEHAIEVLPAQCSSRSYSDWDNPGPNNKKEKSNQTATLSVNSSFGQSYTSVGKNMIGSSSQKKWSSLFKDEGLSSESKEVEQLKTSAPEVDALNSDKFSEQWEDWDYASNEFEGSRDLTLDANALHANNSSFTQELSQFLPGTCGCSVTKDQIYSHECKKEEPKASSSEMNNKELEPLSRCGNVCLDELRGILKDSVDFENYEELLDVLRHYGVVTEKGSMDNWLHEAAMVSEPKLSFLDSLTVKLLLQVAELRCSQFTQLEKMGSLERELVESKREVQHLKGQLATLEARLLCDANESKAGGFQSINELRKSLDGSILVVGGSDGCSWVSTLDSYIPSNDQMQSLSSMSLVRSCASAAKLHDEVFILGGICGDLLYDTVESYDLMNNQWVRRPSLIRKKVNLAGVTLGDKIFAIGGGDGNHSFSEVEMLDLDVGKWIRTRSMLHERFAPAAAEINGMLYVAGGYDGANYLSSAERFDPRGPSWERLESMNTARGCHSLVALHGKLYAIGGHNGATMVPTIEAFDPRVGCWMMEKSMNKSRGYFGAGVIKDTIYVLGGVDDRGEVLDTVERYTEGSAWELTNPKGIGKRCLFPAVVI